MKIVIVTTRHGTKDDRIYYKQAISLAKRFNVVIIAPDDDTNLELEDGIHYHPIPRRNGVIGRLWSIAEAMRAIRQENPNFCHLHDLDLSLAIPAISLFTKSKIIYDSHEVFTRDDLILGSRLGAWVGNIIARLAEKAEKLLLMYCHHVVTAVDPVGRAFQGVKIPHTIIFNYPSLSVFQVDSDRVETIKTRYSGRLPIIYHGTMSVERGLFHMLEAVALARQVEPRLQLRLIGMPDGDLRELVMRKLSELDIHSNVEISGWIPYDEIALAIHTSLIGLVPLLPNPKYDRALPIKLLEYMACGLPVIAAKLPLVAQYVNECNGGVLYEPANTEALSRAILELLSVPDMRRQMGENGRRAVEERWNWDKMEETLFGVYESLGAKISDSY